MKRRGGGGGVGEALWDSPGLVGFCFLCDLVRAQALLAIDWIGGPPEAPAAVASWRKPPLVSRGGGWGGRGVVGGWVGGWGGGGGQKRG